MKFGTLATNEKTVKGSLFVSDHFFLSKERLARFLYEFDQFS